MNSTKIYLGDFQRYQELSSYPDCLNLATQKEKKKQLTPPQRKTENLNDLVTDIDQFESKYFLRNKQKFNG